MARALWSGAISFGLINIPVELYPAEERREFKFAMLDKRDFSPVGYKRYSKHSGKEVAWEDIVKGYEYEKGQYVVLSDEDFRRANVKASRTIDVKAFVPLEEIPVEYFETPYYLVPGPRAEKVYALLRETLRSTGRVAVGQVVIRTTEHLAAVLPLGRALILDTLRYADRLRDAKGLTLPKEGLKTLGISAKETELAKRLVEDMAAHWDADAFKDSYHGDLMARIREKVRKGETHEITKPEAEKEARPSAEVIDLAALLRDSLKGGRKQARRSATSSPESHARSAARAHPRASGKRKTA